MDVLLHPKQMHKGRGNGKFSVLSPMTLHVVSLKTYETGNLMFVDLALLH